MNELSMVKQPWTILMQWQIPPF